MLHMKTSQLILDAAEIIMAEAEVQTTAQKWNNYNIQLNVANCQQLVDDLPSLIFLPLYNTVIRYFAILYEASSEQVFVFSFFSKAAISNLRLFRQIIPSTQWQAATNRAMVAPLQPTYKPIIIKSLILHLYFNHFYTYHESLNISCCIPVITDAKQFYSCTPVHTYVYHCQSVVNSSSIHKSIFTLKATFFSKTIFQQDNY